MKNLKLYTLNFLAPTTAIQKIDALNLSFKTWLLIFIVASLSYKLIELLLIYRHPEWEILLQHSITFTADFSASTILIEISATLGAFILGYSGVYGFLKLTKAAVSYKQILLWGSLMISYQFIFEIFNLLLLELKDLFPLLRGYTQYPYAIGALWILIIGLLNLVSIAQIGFIRIILAHLILWTLQANFMSVVQNLNHFHSQNFANSINRLNSDLQSDEPYSMLKQPNQEAAKPFDKNHEISLNNESDKKLMELNKQCNKTWEDTTLNITPQNFNDVNLYKDISPNNYSLESQAIYNLALINLKKYKIKGETKMISAEFYGRDQNQNTHYLLTDDQVECVIKIQNFNDSTEKTQRDVKVTNEYVFKGNECFQKQSNRQFIKLENQTCTGFIKDADTYFNFTP